MKVTFKQHTPWYYYISPDRWLAYGMFILKKIVDKYHRGSSISEIAYCEQIIYRKMCCPACQSSNKANCCDCDFRGKILQRKESCKFFMWPEMMSDAEWNDYKIKNNINISI